MGGVDGLIFRALTGLKSEPEPKIYHSRNGDITQDEFEEIVQQSIEAHERGDVDKAIELSNRMPLNPDVAKAIKEVYGKDYLIEADFDLTEANIEFGDNWLDE